LTGIGALTGIVAVTLGDYVWCLPLSVSVLVPGWGQCHKGMQRDAFLSASVTATSSLLQEIFCIPAVKYL
jgi:hypothetical protein